MTRDANKTKAQLIEELKELRKINNVDEQFRLISIITEQVSDSVIATDLDFHIIYENRAFRALYGYEPGELAGRTPDFLNAEPLAADIQRQLYETVASHKTWRGTVLNRRKDGTTFKCDLAIFPLLDENGEIFAYAGTQRDVTERDRAEEKLRESEERFRNLAQLLPEAIFETDPNLKIVYGNQRAFDVTGYSPEDLSSGLHAFELLVPEDRERAKATFTERMKGNAPGPTEYQALRKDGSTLPVLFHASSIITNGEFQGLRGVLVDITERKQVEQERLAFETQVQNAQKLESMGVLAGGIAHDFNNLLTGVLGNAELAMDDLPPSSPARESIEAVQEAAKRAAELSHQMLAYSGRGTFVVQPLSLSEVVKQMGQLLNASISKKTELEYRLDDAIPAIQGDVAQIRQIVMNLITNADEALEGRTGTLSVTTGVMEFTGRCSQEGLVAGSLSKGKYAYLEVSDSGVGMDQEIIAKMFEPFFTTKFVGRGLGLAALFGIVRGHKGAVQVNSKPGSGTTITVWFPVTEKPAVSLVDNKVAAEDTQAQGTILLVDDEPAALDVGARMLERAGYEVITACDGSEAVEMLRLRSHDTDCVILDLTMPIMDGEETFVELQKIRNDVPVVLSSGYSAGDVEARVSMKGFAGFLQKPYRMNALMQAVRQATGE